MAELLDEPVTFRPDGLEGDDRERSPIQWIACIIRPESLEAVTAALEKLHVVGGMTLTDVRGCGRQKGQTEHYRGEEYTIRLIPKLKIELAVLLGDVERVLAAINSAARTGQIGDGKAFLVDVETAVRVRTGERGLHAL